MVSLYQVGARLCACWPCQPAPAATSPALLSVLVAAASTIAVCVCQGGSAGAGGLGSGATGSAGVPSGAAHSFSTSLKSYLREASVLSREPLHGLDPKAMAQLAKGPKPLKQVYNRLQQLEVGPRKPVLVARPQPVSQLLVRPGCADCC
jgi:hypothetical protein